MLRTFNIGGVHPPENKLSEKSPIVVLPIPETVVIPVAQHLGVPAIPVVAKGDQVKAGQLIARSSAFISGNIHSSVSGKVIKIDDMPDSCGYLRKAIVIKVEGDEWIEGINTSPGIIRECFLSPKEIVDKVIEMGVVGMGGATFPSGVKLMPPPGKKIEVLIINGVECEPYLTSDHRLMVERPEEILIGVSLLMKATGAGKAMIGIENNKPDAIEIMKHSAQDFPGITIHPLKVKYPQGGEKQLIQALTNRMVPSGKLPIEVGAIVFNVGTAFAVYEAVQKNKPLVERVVTITGKNLEKPSNYLVRIGTPVRALIEAAGGLPSDTGKLVNGGPMMGKALNSVDVPVTKGCSGILLFRDPESLRKPAVNCIRCARCLDGCCMGLEPYLLAVLAEKKRFEDCETQRIMDCIECGSCSYICPSGRPLLDHIRVGKAETGKMIRKRSGN
ncbi:MAG TPA: electron transport complex subunit RsxC [Bacteroidales bacterium]|nr:electron transport complex subunit RsxC [Bacteroidales bacterium]